MTHTIRIVVTSVILFVIAYAVLWQMGLFDNLGFHGTIAAVLGVFLSSALAIGLMTAMFHSNRTHHDDEAHRVKWEQK